jgi:hypothetical protein
MARPLLLAIALSAVACRSNRPTTTQTVTEIAPNLPGAGDESANFQPVGCPSDAGADADTDATDCPPALVRPSPIDAAR